VPRRTLDRTLIVDREPGDDLPGLAPGECARLRGAIVHAEILEERFGADDASLSTAQLFDLYHARTHTLRMFGNADLMAHLFTDDQLDAIFPAKEPHPC
jgi:hypothetical protein